VVWPLDQLDRVVARGRKHGLALHLDGARLWNAAVFLGVPERRIGALFDSVSVCFSKGLGAPVGSALCGSRDLVRRARRLRKRLGGGMRQVGILAAAARYALAHNRQDLAADHANARAIAELLAEVPQARVNVDAVQTNIVMVDTPGVPSEQVVTEAAACGVLVAAFGPERVRVVTHRDVAATAREGGQRLASAIGALGRSS
jgi:threonine aldolase